ncbi:MAG: PTS sugar transporter subunit IIA [Candidatus Latescibacterota bacterium]
MPANPLRILVPLRDPADELSLVRLAAALVPPTGGQLHLVHVVDPDAGRPERLQEPMQQAGQAALEMGISAVPHLEEGEDVTVVVSAGISRWGCNMLLMGWRAEVERDAILAATNRALTKAIHVDTLIFKERDFHPARRILVPTGGGAHSAMCLQIAHDLARRWGAEVDVVRVARDPRSLADDPLLARYCQQLREETEVQLGLLGIAAPLTIIPSPTVVPPIVERARRADLVVLGASNDWQQDEHLAGSIPDEIARHVGCSVLMVRQPSGQAGRSLGSLFWENTIRLQMRARDKWDAIAQLVDALVEEQQIPASQRDAVLEAAVGRERKGSTALGHATAVPHAPIPHLPGLIGCMAICPGGVDFGSADGPTQFVFLLLTPLENYRNYIPVLAQIATLMRREPVRRSLLACQTPAEAASVLRAPGGR